MGMAIAIARGPIWLEELCLHGNSLFDDGAFRNGKEDKAVHLS